MRYQEFLAELQSFADENYRDFHKKLLKNYDIRVLGVRVPTLRKLAKKYINFVDELLEFPDEYYEVTFVKLTAVSYLNWEEFIKYVDKCVPLIDNWATCDCFAPKCIEKHRDEFLPYIYKYLENDGEFYKRFALTTLLRYYVDENYFGVIFDILKAVDTEKYYVHMAAAWLIAELLIKNYSDTVSFLQKGVIDKRTHNKAIQKACESYRLSDEQKNFLKGMKK